MFFVFSLMIMSTTSHGSDIREIVVPFSPGGQTSTFGRIVQQYLKEDVRIETMLINKAGADGIIGARYATEQTSNSRLLVVSSGFMINFVMYDKLGYEYSDFDIVAPMTISPAVLVVSNKSNIPSMSVFIKEARSRPLNCGVSNSAASFVAKYIIKQLGFTNIEIINFKGGGELSVALLGGIIDCAFDTLQSSYEAHRADKSKIIAVASKTAHRLVPNAVLFNEYVTGFNFNFWTGIAIPKSNSDPDKYYIMSKLKKLTQTPGYKEKLNYLNLDIAVPEENGIRFVGREIKQFELIQQQLNIQKIN
jgi:tripartite-type tricarboxylate transporter receptor subunit TctC